MKRKMLKGKILVWLLAVMMIVASMTGCGGKEDEEDKDTKSKTEQSVDDEKDEDSETEDKESEVVDKKEDEESEVVDEKAEDAAKEEEKVVEEEEDTKETTEVEVTAEVYDVVEKMVEACQGKMMTKSSMNMEVEMSIGVEGFFIDMDMVMNSDTYASIDPFTTYTEMTLDMNAMGQDMSEIVKSYTVEEDGKIVSYAYSSSDNQWFKEVVDIDVATLMEQQKVTYHFLLTKPAEEYVLDSELHNINGKDAYKLSFTLTGAELMETMRGVEGVEELLAEAGMENLDMTALRAPTVYYVDAESYLIVGMEMSMEGMDEMIDKMMTELMAAEGEEYSMSFELGKCNMICSDISYEPVEIPAMPEEVLSMQWESVDAGFDM